MNNKHVVFGQVVNLDAAEKILNRLETVRVDQRERPLRPITIINCGEIGDKTAFLRNDPFSKENMAKIKDANRYNRLYLEEKDHYMKADQEKEEMEKAKEKQNKKGEDMKKEIREKYFEHNLLGKREFMVVEKRQNEEGNKEQMEGQEHGKGKVTSSLAKELIPDFKASPSVKKDVQDTKTPDPANPISNTPKTTLKPHQAQFMEQIRQKINNKITENFEIVAEAKLAQAEGRQPGKRFKLSRKRKRLAAKLKKKALEKGDEQARTQLLHQTAFENTRRRKPKKEMFGWNVFNEDAKYQAYKKRVKELVVDKELFREEERKLKEMGKIIREGGPISGNTERDRTRGDEQSEVSAFLKSHNLGHDMRNHEDIQRGNMAVQKIIGDKGNETELRLERLVDTIKNAEEKRKKFQRRRPFDPNSKVSYVNDRNRVYNEKLSRYFGTYVKEVEGTLARAGN